jgi:hypothetical protein
MNGGRMHQGSASVVRAKVDAEAFERLVAGEMAVLRGVTEDNIVQVEIFLCDIGYDRMLAAVDREAKIAAKCFRNADP